MWWYKDFFFLLLSHSAHERQQFCLLPSPFFKYHLILHESVNTQHATCHIKRYLPFAFRTFAKRRWLWGDAGRRLKSMLFIQPERENDISEQKCFITVPGHTLSSWRSRTCWHRFSLIFSSAYRFKWNLSTQIWGVADFLITLLQWNWLSFYWRDAFLLQVMLWNVPDWWRIIWSPLNPTRIQDYMTSLAQSGDSSAAKVTLL